MTLSSEVISICKATAPVLKEHGLAITQKFYENLFENHPYVNNLFNKSHVFPKKGQVSTQASALANAVLGYATVCENDQKSLHFFSKKEKSTRCLKITEKVSFNIASEASYVYFLSGQKLIKNAKMFHFGEFLKT